MRFNINLNELESVASDYMSWRNAFFKERAKKYRKNDICFIDNHRRLDDALYRTYDLMEVYEKATRTACYILGIQFDSVIAAQRAINKYYNGRRDGYISMEHMERLFRHI